MSPEISERAFEEAIECALLAYGPETDTDRRSFEDLRGPRVERSNQRGFARRIHQRRSHTLSHE